MRGDWGSPISENQSNAYDFDRLERAVNALGEERSQLRAESEALRERLDQSENRARSLDERLLDMNQRRQDALKRIDELVSQIEVLAEGFAAESD